MKDDSRNDVTPLFRGVPLRVVVACGLAGVAVDGFDGLALLGAPEWFHKLDVLAAVGYTAAVLCVGAYISLRHNRARGATEDS
jgi:hypothetical protein